MSALHSPCLPYRVAELTTLTTTISKLILMPDAAASIHFKAGQYVFIHQKGVELSPFSVACAPNLDQRIEIHLHHPQTNRSALSILAEAQKAKKLFLSGPAGNATLARLDLGRPIIFLARGTGFAPIKAILEVLPHGAGSDIYFYWGSHAQSEFYHLELLQSWAATWPGFRFNCSVSRSADQYQLHHQIVNDLGNLEYFQVYASGSPQMVLAARDDFIQHGLEPQACISDVFDWI